MTGKHGSGWQAWQQVAGVAAGGRRGSRWQPEVGMAGGDMRGSGWQAWQWVTGVAAGARS